MSNITPQDVERMIKDLYPEAVVEIIEHGQDPNVASMTRYSVKTTLFDAEIEVRLAANVIFLVDNVPREAIKLVALLHSDDVKREVKEWLTYYRKYLQKQEIPKAKELARRYLGREEEIKKKKGHAIYIYYDMFFIVITATRAFMHVKKSGYLIHQVDISDPNRLEYFFRIAAGFAEQIRKDTYK